jgi:hypothetical protein
VRAVLDGGQPYRLNVFGPGVTASRPLKPQRSWALHHWSIQADESGEAPEVARSSTAIRCE